MKNMASLERIDLLERKLAVATRWLRNPLERERRVKWGRCGPGGAYGYTLDGDYVGDTLEDVIDAGARKGASSREE